MIEIRVNGEPRSISRGSTVTVLLETVGVLGQGIAIAINGEVVPRSMWQYHYIDEHDKIEILAIAQGG